jgi:hypothetical protein
MRPMHDAVNQIMETISLLIYENNLSNHEYLLVH